MKRKLYTLIASTICVLLANAPAHANYAPEPYRAEVVLHKCATHGISSQLAQNIERNYYKFPKLKRGIIRVLYYGDKIREKQYCEELKKVMKGI
jgi:hypothetical protein